MVLPPGVTAKRRLRAFKVYVLVHTRRIIVCHPMITYRRQQLIYYYGSVITSSIIKSMMCVILTQKKSVRMPYWVWTLSWSSEDI